MVHPTKQIIDELTETELFQKVSEICATVNAVTNARELLEVSLKKTMALFGANRGSIFMLKENGKDLILKIAQGMALNEQEKLIKRIGEGVVGRVAALKKPVVVENIAKDRRFKGFKSRNSYRTSSFICAPLLIKDKLIGVINITDKKCGSRFKPKDMQLLDFLTSQIALNYRRIQLYHKFKMAIKETKTLKSELGRSSQETSYLKKQIILQEKLASIGKLAGGIAHEFNNPLDGVMRYTNLCLEQVKDQEVLCGYLFEIKHGLDRMANIVKSLLACSRNLPPLKDKVNPNLVIDQALQSLQTEIYHKNIKIEKNLTDPLPEIGDLGLERVILNVLRNAVDAVTHQGQIKVTTAYNNGSLAIEIHDNGCGIPADNIEKIFEPFFTTKDMDKGCGLGLTIVSEIVKSYNGQINVESSIGQGTIFTIHIPVTL